MWDSSGHFLEALRALWNIEGTFFCSLLVLWESFWEHFRVSRDIVNHAPKPKTPVLRAESRESLSPCFYDLGLQNIKKRCFQESFNKNVQFQSLLHIKNIASAQEWLHSSQNTPSLKIMHFGIHLGAVFGAKVATIRLVGSLFCLIDFLFAKRKGGPTDQSLTNKIGVSRAPWGPQ